jgi:hypothetical protein
MRSPPLSLRLMVLGGIAVFAGGLCVRCGGNGTHVVGTADGGVDAADPDGAGDSAEVWDPVWHETEPAQWPTVGPEGQPDCGPGCRIALNLPVSHPGYFSYGYDAHRVADTNVATLHYADIGGTTTHVIAARAEGVVGFVQPYIHGSFISYLASDYPKGVVELMNLTTGEMKSVYSYDDGDHPIVFTAVNDRYAFWYQDGRGLMARNLTTGELRVLSFGVFSCHGLCATPTALICGQVAERILRIDQETGEETTLDDGGALQVDSNCSPDRRRVAWVDYRDPPGPGSTYDFHRNGGEIYMKDLESNVTTRLTFDSPNDPRGKYGPAVDGDTVVWMEPCPTCDPNPQSMQALAASTTLVRFDLAIGKKCRTEMVIGSPSLHGRHLYGYWLDKSENETRLVDIDLDDPGIEWSCD